MQHKSNFHFGRVVFLDQNYAHPYTIVETSEDKYNQMTLKTTNKDFNTIRHILQRPNTKIMFEMKLNHMKITITE